MQTDGPAPQNADSAARQPSAQEIADVRTRLQQMIGQAVMALSATARYRHEPLSNLQHLVLDPLMADRIAFAEVKAGKSEGLGGIALWASVSQEVDAKIREQIAAGVFPIRLNTSDWTSGEIVWLLDVIAPSQQLASAVVTNFQQVLKQPASVHVHPIVSRQLDPKLLSRLRAAKEPVTETKTADDGALTGAAST